MAYLKKDTTESGRCCYEQDIIYPRILATPKNFKCVPNEQFWQTRLDVAVTSVLIYWPAVQFAVAAHARSMLAVGAVDWYCAPVQFETDCSRGKEWR